MPWKKENGSLFELYKELIALRKRERALRKGSFVVEGITEKGVYIYSRKTEDVSIRVTINRTKEFHLEKMENIIAERGYGNGRLMPYGFVIEREEI